MGYTMWPLTAQQIADVVCDKTNAIYDYGDLIIEGICQDHRKLKSNFMFISIMGDKFDGHSFLKQAFQNNLQLALVQKNSPYLEQLTPQERARCLCVDDVIFSLRKLAQFMRQSFAFPVIGIGGSNGKTTTKEILFSMLLGAKYKVTKTEKSENGFLGMAMTILQEGHNIHNPPNTLVLEIGIDDIGAMEQHVQLSQPNIALLTALGPEHLTGLKDWETAAKEELILFSCPSSTKIWQLNDEKIRQHFSSELKKGLNLKNDFIVVEKDQQSQVDFSSIFVTVVWHITKENEDSLNLQIEIHKQNHEIIIPGIFTLPLLGKHNAANFALAFAAALAAGRTPEEITEGFKHFTPPPMRSNLRTLPNGAQLFDDTYNASPLSVQAALSLFEKPNFSNKEKIVVLGDMLELGIESNYWHESLVPTLKKLKHTHLCLYGAAMYSCYKLLHEMKEKLVAENETRVFWLSEKEEPARFLELIEIKDWQKEVILVKGSRGMRLERFIKAAEEKCKTY